MWMDAEQGAKSHPDSLPKSGLFMDALEKYLSGKSINRNRA